MRYAMSVPVTDFMKKSIDMGGLAQSGTALRSAIDNAGISLQGDVGAAGITSQADVEAAKLVGAAQKAVAKAQEDAAMMNMFSNIGGGFTTGLGNMGGGIGDLPTKLDPGKTYGHGYGTLNKFPGLG